MSKEDKLRSAIMINNVKKVMSLLDKGTDVNKHYDYANSYTPLIIAVLKGNETIVEILLDKGAKVNDQDKYGYTALMYAVINDNKNIVKMLLDKFADVNIMNKLYQTALMIAEDQHNPDIIDILKNKENMETIYADEVDVHFLPFDDSNRVNSYSPVYAEPLYRTDAKRVNAQVGKVIETQTSNDGFYDINAEEVNGGKNSRKKRNSRKIKNSRKKRNTYNRKKK
jgi:ankyrin repeat protein